MVAKNHPYQRQRLRPITQNIIQVNKIRNEPAIPVDLWNYCEHRSLAIIQKNLRKYYITGSYLHRKDTPKLIILKGILDNIRFFWMMKWRPLRDSNPCCIRERDMS